MKSIAKILTSTLVLPALLFCEEGKPMSIADSGMVLVDIPAGIVAIKDRKVPGAGKARKTKVSAFRLSACEINYATWEKVHKWGAEHGYAFRHPGQMGSHKAAGTDADAPEHDPREPVVGIDWYDCVLWCNAASEMEGLSPCYYLDEAQTKVYRTGAVDLANTMVDWDAGGYRLPTVAEWHHASQWNSRDGFPDPAQGERRSRWAYIQEYAWDGVNSEGRTHPVGTKKPNNMGLYDMYGNASEWFWDRFTFTMDPADDTDPRGPDQGDVHPNEPDSKAVLRTSGGIHYLGKMHPATKRYASFADGHNRELQQLSFRVATSALNKE